MSYNGRRNTNVEPKMYTVLSMPTNPLPSSIYFVLNKKHVNIYVTDKNGVPYPVISDIGVPGGITNILSPKGTIDVHKFNNTFNIDIKQSILDEINKIPNLALKTTQIIAGLGLKGGGDLSSDVTIDVDFSEVATAEQGDKADTALQPGDNISELVNDVGYITSSNLPDVNDGELKMTTSGIAEGEETFTANDSDNKVFDVYVPPTDIDLYTSGDELHIISSTGDGDKVDLSFLRDKNKYIKADGSVDFEGNQSMGGFELTNLGQGTDGDDAARRDELTKWNGIAW